MFKKVLSLSLSLSLLGGAAVPSFYAESPQSSIQQTTADNIKPIEETKSKISHKEYKKLKEKFKKLKKECKELEVYKDVKIQMENNSPSFKEFLATLGISFCGSLPLSYLASHLFELSCGVLPCSAGLSLLIMLNWAISKL